MGTLTYGTTVFEFEDRLLAHLKIVIVQKLRRRESFLLSWQEPLETGGGRSSIWISEAAIMHFRFNGSRSPALNREWLDRLMVASYTGNGLVVHELPESVEPTPASRASSPNAKEQTAVK
ncbi:MAG: hypothetical protein JWP30_1993 [Homoserinimonas sp.]|jgi:hypothetical protein|nr:hypothetical protein [Homoserinimonas sp.]